jgi:hypothetical protein
MDLPALVLFAGEELYSQWSRRIAHKEAQSSAGQLTLTGLQSSKPRDLPTL